MNTVRYIIARANQLRFQTRAFMLLPMTFNIGVIIGPILGMAHPFSEALSGLK
jgi:hypothetical protein